MGVSRQEKLWRGASLVGSCEVNSVSEVNRECRKWRLPGSGRLGGRRIKKRGKWCPPALLCLRKVPTDTCSSSVCPKSVNVSPSDVAQVLLKLRPLLWDSESVTWVSHSPLAPPDVSPSGSQSYRSWGLLFLVQVPQAGTRTPCSSGGLCGCAIPPTFRSQPGEWGVGRVQTRLNL